MASTDWGYPRIQEESGARTSDCGFTISLQPDLGEIISISADFILNRDISQIRFLCNESAFQHTFIWHGKERKCSSKNGRQDRHRTACPSHPIKNLVRLN